MPPVILWALGAIGAGVAAKWLMKEARRVNAELDAVRAEPIGEEARRDLKPDPQTGVYRPQ